VDSHLRRAIATPRIRQQAGDLVKLSLRALADLGQLDESLYERFVEARKSPEDPMAARQRTRKLWNDTFRSLRELLAYMKSVLSAKTKATQDENAISESH
jgi:hypothetical protein